MYKKGLTALSLHSYNQSMKTTLCKAIILQLAGFLGSGVQVFGFKIGWTSVDHRSEGITICLNDSPNSVNTRQVMYHSNEIGRYLLPNAPQSYTCAQIQGHKVAQVPSEEMEEVNMEIKQLRVQLNEDAYGCFCMAASGLSCRKPLVSTGWAICLLCTNGLAQKTVFWPCRTSISVRGFKNYLKWKYGTFRGSLGSK